MKSLPRVAPALVAVLAAACASTPSAPSDDTRRPMPIERVDVLEMRSLPVQWVVSVEGYLPDSCWAFDAAAQRREQQTFVVELTMKRTAPADAVCLQRIEPVQRNVPLGALPPGEYVVSVNGTVQKTFRVP